MSALSLAKQNWSGALPANSAPRLVTDFLNRHGLGLSDICARVQHGAEERLAAVRTAVNLAPTQPDALAEQLLALAECLDAAQGRDDVATPQGMQPQPDLDAAIRWNVARLHDLSKFCRAV